MDNKNKRNKRRQSIDVSVRAFNPSIEHAGGTKTKDVDWDALGKKGQNKQDRKVLEEIRISLEEKEIRKKKKKAVAMKKAKKTNEDKKK